MEKLNESFQKNLNKHTVLSNLMHTDTTAWKNYLMHLNESSNINLIYLLENQIKNNNINNAFIYLIVGNKLQVAYVTNSKINLIDDEPQLTELETGMEKILSHFPLTPPPDKLTTLSDEDAKFLKSQTVDTETEVELCETKAYAERAFAYKLVDGHGGTIYQMSKIIEETPTVIPSKDRSPRELLHRRNRDLYFYHKNTFKSRAFEDTQKSKIDLTISSIKSIYETPKQYEPLGFALAGVSNISKLEEDATESAKSLMSKIKSLHTLNVRIDKLEKTLTDEFFQDEKELTANEKKEVDKVEARKQEMAAKEALKIKTERGKVLNLALMQALDDKAIKVCWDHREKKISPEPYNDLMRAYMKEFENVDIATLPFPLFYQKILNIQDTVNNTSLFASITLRNAIKTFHKNNPGYITLLPPKKKSTSFFEQAGHIQSEVLRTILSSSESATPTPKREPVDIKAIDTQLKELHEQRENLTQDINDHTKALQEKLDNDSKTVKEASRLFLKRKILEEALAIVNATLVKDSGTSSQKKIDFWGTQTNWYMATGGMFNLAPTGIQAIRKLSRNKNIFTMKEKDLDEMIKMLPSISDERLKHSSSRTQTTATFYSILGKIPRDNKSLENETSLYDSLMRIQEFRKKAAQNNIEIIKKAGAGR